MSEQDSWIVVHFENGQIDYWEGGGEWHSDEREQYVRQGDDLIFGLEMEEEIWPLIQEREFATVKLSGVGFVVESGYWSDWGYVFPEAHIEWENVQIMTA